MLFFLVVPMIICVCRYRAGAIMYLIYVVTLLLAICFLRTAQQCFKENVGRPQQKIPKRNGKKIKSKAQGLLIGELRPGSAAGRNHEIWMPLAVWGTM